MHDEDVLEEESGFRMNAEGDDGIEDVEAPEDFKFAEEYEDEDPDKDH